MCKQKNMKNKLGIVPMRLLDKYEKEVFDDYRQRIELIDDELVVETLSKLESLEEEFEVYKEQGLNEVLQYFEDEYNILDKSDNTQKINLIEFMEKNFIIRNLDAYYKNKLGEIKSSIDSFTFISGKNNQERIEEINKLIDNVNSFKLSNHVKIYLNNYHNNELLLLNHLIKDFFECLKSAAMEYIHRAEIVFFNKLEMIATDSQELITAFENIQEILGGNSNHSKIHEILRGLDKKGLNNLVEEKILEQLDSSILIQPYDELKTTYKYQKGKHYDFKELEKLALEQGYILNRISGDHYIYSNKIKKHSIPIPCRRIGKGLSMSIKKELLKN